MPSRQRITKKRVTYKNDKKRKANESYAFDDDILFMHSDDVCNKVEANVDSDEE
jgi:hypothetical protein